MILGELTRETLAREILDGFQMFQDTTIVSISIDVADNILEVIKTAGYKSREEWNEYVDSVEVEHETAFDVFCPACDGWSEGDAPTNDECYQCGYRNAWTECREATKNAVKNIKK